MGESHGVYVTTAAGDNDYQTRVYTRDMNIDGSKGAGWAHPSNFSKTSKKYV
jgi:hypothetical protein